MRRLLVSTLAIAVLFVAATGCTGQRSAYEERIRNLEAENAALRAQADSRRTPTSAPKPAIEPDERARLEAEGFKVTDDGRTFTLSLGSKVLFASGKATLRPAARRALDQAASLIKRKYADAKIVVQGHTDSQPIKRTIRRWKNNQELSVARAKAVATHLRQAGVEATNVVVQGFGATKPVATNKTKKGRELNRRVELVVRIRR